LLLSGRTDFCLAYEQRLKDWADLVSVEAEGYLRGNIGGRISVAIAMIEDNVDKSVVKYSGLTEVGVDIIKEFLDNPNYPISELSSLFKIDEKRVIEIYKENNINIENRGIETNTT